MALIRLYIALALLGGEVMEGVAPYYAKGVMERVAARRGITADVCHVSSAWYPIGTPVYVYGVNTGVLRGCIVTDVSALVDTTGRHSAESDRDRHRRTRRHIELGNAEARSICGAAAMRGPPRDCPVFVFRIDE